MLTKAETTQLEMFDQFDLKQNLLSAQEPNDAARLKKMRLFQRSIAYVLSVFIISIVSFSFGVEKGKYLLSRGAVSPIVNQKSVLPAQTKSSASIQNSQVKTNELKEKTQNTTFQLKKDKTIKEFKSTNYTIQVASISKNNSIKNILDKLQKNGYRPFSLTKGKYTIICAGKFTQRNEALVFLQKLKNRYPDSLIRKL